jgi:hypothetical protein
VSRLIGDPGREQRVGAIEQPVIDAQDEKEQR